MPRGGTDHVVDDLLLLVRHRVVDVLDGRVRAEVGVLNAILVLDSLQSGSDHVVNDRLLLFGHLVVDVLDGLTLLLVVSRRTVVRVRER
jgi:hypothetical protein